MKKMDEAIIQRFTDFMSVQFPQDLSMHQWVYMNSARRK
jgi:hypothetical protein